jgi:two-component system, OmpR family, phosphate regulon response regulator PhoB
MKKSLVLVVEDEKAIAELLAVNLRHGGFDVQVADCAEAAQTALNDRLPDLAIVDWMLPGVSGAALCRRWREHPRTKALPIVMLTAKASERDKIEGLDAGADDYVTKPFSPQELLARIRALLRRRAPELSQSTQRLGLLELNPTTHRVLHGGEELKLAPTEFKLLACLMAAPERVHSRQSLIDKVWGDHVVIEDRTVDVHVKRLREALGDAAAMVETVRGVGYRLSAKPGVG